MRSIKLATGAIPNMMNMVSYYVLSFSVTNIYYTITITIDDNAHPYEQYPWTLPPRRGPFNFPLVDGNREFIPPNVK